MLTGLLYLMVSQLLGYLTVIQFNLPIPSPVLGLVYLFGYLLILQHIPESLIKVASVLLPLLPLFLLPASVGIVEHGALLRENALAITVTLVVSLVIPMLITPFIFQFFIRLFHRAND